MPIIVAIIQARMSSSRLPGKSLAKVYKNFSLLELVLLRVLKAKKPDTVVLATSKQKDCDPLEELATRLGVVTIRGSETDVLSRFVLAIKQFKPDSVVRVCADNPLIDPGEIDKLVSFFQKNQVDYAANNTPKCGLPDGLGCEIIKADVLLKVSEKALNDRYCEHVTKYITEHQDDFMLGRLHAERRLWCPDSKLDIDTKEDLDKMREFCSALPSNSAPYWTASKIIGYARYSNSVWK